MEYVFSKPYEFEGKTYDKIEFDLENLKGSDFAAAKKQFAKNGNFSVAPQADSEFCALILERVAKQPIDFFENLPAKDYCAITQQVANFLLG